ncbi:hypothetical protein BJL96_08660 [Burkholderia cenocepacia]|nr:hypothetical protein A3203_09520 [Burkholderia cenocepacia]NGO93494.1 hypothetical protein [Burkholderia cenocepacia]
MSPTRITTFGATPAGRNASMKPWRVAKPSPSDTNGSSPHAWRSIASRCAYGESTDAAKDISSSNSAIDSISASGSGSAISDAR